MEHGEVPDEQELVGLPKDVGNMSANFNFSYGNRETLRATVLDKMATLRGPAMCSSNAA